MHSKRLAITSVLVSLLKLQSVLGIVHFCGMYTSTSLSMYSILGLHFFSQAVKLNVTNTIKKVFSIVTVI